MGVEIFDGITRADVLQAVRDFEAGSVSHKFIDSTVYDLLVDGKRYPPKAILGISARRSLGHVLLPSEFGGGLGSKCFSVLESLEFVIVTKAKGDAENALSKDDLAPSVSGTDLDAKVRKIRKRGTKLKPEGSEAPDKTTVAREEFKRDPLVKAWVLNAAEGACELCLKPAPFRDADGYPFLEVHHVNRLSDGGSDTTYNAVALCPNCHRSCHFSGDRDQEKERLYAKVGRLIRED